MAVRWFGNRRKTVTADVDAAALRIRNNQLEEKLRTLETEHCSLWMTVLRGGGKIEDVPEKYRERVRNLQAKEGSV